MIGWLVGCGSGSTATSASSSLSSKGRSSSLEKAQERTRIERSYSGVLVFDEAHKAKNLEADTRTARLVIALQERLPNARVLYCSATGVSDIKHMVYATRLGLWGSANPLYPTFDSFQGALAKRGVGAMEMLALEMKRKGIFLARTLSWDGAEFHTLEVKLSDRQVSMYDGAVRWWFQLKDKWMRHSNSWALPRLRLRGGFTGALISDSSAKCAYAQRLMWLPSKRSSISRTTIMPL